jgi:hypothetical protein
VRIIFPFATLSSEDVNAVWVCTNLLPNFEPNIRIWAQERVLCGDNYNDGAHSRLPASQAPRLPVSQAPSLPGSQSPRLPASQPPSLSASQPPSLSASQPLSLSASQPPSLPVHVAAIATG